jgi:hypothetical protein
VVLVEVEGPMVIMVGVGVEVVILVGRPVVVVTDLVEVVLMAAQQREGTALVMATSTSHEIKCHVYSICQAYRLTLNPHQKKLQPKKPWNNAKSMR